MGFQRGFLKLEFEDPEFSGLEVRAHRFSVQEVLDMTAYGKALAQGGTKEELAEHVNAIADLLDRKIVGWNYEDDDGTPIVKSASAIAALDERMMTAIMRGIREGSAGISGPLGTPSSGGVPPLEVSLPMEPLPESPPS